MLLARVAEFRQHPGRQGGKPFVEAEVELAPGIDPGGPPVDTVTVLTVVEIDPENDTLNGIRKRLAKNAFDTLKRASEYSAGEIESALVSAATKSPYD